MEEEDEKRQLDWLDTQSIVQDKVPVTCVLFRAAIGDVLAMRQDVIYLPPSEDVEALQLVKLSASFAIAQSVKLVRQPFPPLGLIDFLM